MAGQVKHKKEKGEYGYRDYHKRIQLMEVLFGGAMIMAQLLARNFTDNQAAKNVLTLMAILSVLPTANVASPLLAAWRYKTCSPDLFQKTSGLEKTGILLYDLIVTSKEMMIPLDAVMVHPKAVVAYCTSPKTDAKKAEKYLNDTFAVRRLDPNVKIIKDEKMFLKRLKELKPRDEFEDDGSVEYGAKLLKNLSM